jgi:hypothetical protein
MQGRARCSWRQSLGLIALARSAASSLAAPKTTRSGDGDHPKKATRHHPSFPHALKQEASAQRIPQVPSFGTRSVGPHSFILFAGGALKT